MLSVCFKSSNDPNNLTLCSPIMAECLLCTVCSYLALSIYCKMNLSVQLKTSYDPNPWLYLSVQLSGNIYCVYVWCVASWL